MAKKVFLNKPTLIVGAGNSATGKTVHLKELAMVLADSFWIDKDTIEDNFLTRMDYKSKDIMRYISNLGIFPRKRKYHFEHVELQTYLMMLKEARNNLLLGKHPILDGNYVKELQEGYFEKVIMPFFNGVDCKIKVIYFFAPEKVMKQRIVDRAEPRDQDKIKSDYAWKEFLEKEPIIIHNINSLPHIMIDSTNSIKDNIKLIIKFLKK